LMAEHEKGAGHVHRAFRLLWPKNLKPPLFIPPLLPSA
jgi:hypothetical protein